jgi:hypothetical protein
MQVLDKQKAVTGERKHYVMGVFIVVFLMQYLRDKIRED